MNGKVASMQFGAKGVQVKALQRRSIVARGAYDEELVKTAVSGEPSNPTLCNKLKLKLCRLVIPLYGFSVWFTIGLCSGLCEVGYKPC